MKLFWTFISLCFLAAVADAATNNAATTAYSDVLAAYNLCNPGDTLAVPSGSSTWASTLTVSINIIFQGAGTNSTFITANADSTPILNFQPSSGFGEVTGFDFNGGGHQSYGALNLSGLVRVDHCVFTNFMGHVIDATGDHGVIDHCSFTNYNLGVEVRDSNWGGHSFGDGSWADNAYLGTTNALYIESCNFGNTVQTGAVDSVDGAHWVFRYNTLVGDILDSHGTETTQRERGSRAIEIYNNNLTGGAGFAEMFEMRSGTGVIFSNTVNSYSSLVSLKTWMLNGIYIPWTATTGVQYTNGWYLYGSSNVESGTVTGGTANQTGTLTDTSKSWTAHQWQGYIIVNLTTGRGAQIFDNTATTLTYNANNFGVFNVTNNNGNTFQINSILAVLDQAGRGKGDLLGDHSSGSQPYDTVTGTTNWPSEASEPIYVWANTLNGTANNSIGVSTASAGLQVLNTDFFSGTAMPGYAPLPFPHPLVQAPATLAVAWTPPGRLARVSYAH
ncbi:MAG: hypothetical protein KGL39_02970 [Patescibacteria group bacterium]|nr:hypothetical protein [Patescibacteria group bacterium]